MLGSIHDVDLRLLRIFVTIAETGGFSRAQAKLNLSQSAISTSMSQLETRLGTRLCRRGHGVFEITDDGQAVLQAAAKLFASLGSFQASVMDLRGKLRGELRIGFCDNSVTHPDERLRTAIQRFTARAPEVHVKVHVGDGDELEEQVTDGRLHLACGIFRDRVASLRYSPLFEEEHLLYCGNEHPFYERSDSELTPEILAEASYASWGQFEAFPGWEQKPQFHGVASAPNLEGIAFLVLSGRYLAYMPTHFARFWCELGQLRAVLPDAMRRTATFHLITPKLSRMPRLASAFMDELGEADEQPVPATNIASTGDYQS